MVAGMELIGRIMHLILLWWLGLLLFVGFCVLYFSSIDFVGFAFGVVQEIIQVLEKSEGVSVYPFFLAGIGG